MTSFTNQQYITLGLENLDIIFGENIHAEAIYSFDFDGQLQLHELLCPVGAGGSEIDISEILSIDAGAEAYEELECKLAKIREENITNKQVEKWEQRSERFSEKG